MKRESHDRTDFLSIDELAVELYIIHRIMYKLDIQVQYERVVVDEVDLV